MEYNQRSCIQPLAHKFFELVREPANWKACPPGQSAEPKLEVPDIFATTIFGVSPGNFWMTTPQVM